MTERLKDWKSEAQIKTLISSYHFLSVTRQEKSKDFAGVNYRTMVPLADMNVRVK